MYQVHVSIRISEQGQYSSKEYARSQRETLATGDDLKQVLAEVTDEVCGDSLKQIDTRKAAESAISE